MKKTSLILPAIVIVMIVVLAVSMSNYEFSPYAFAKDKTHHNNGAVGSKQFSGISYDAMYTSNQYVESFTPLPLTSKVADILSSSFTDILDTQINTGMKNN